MRRDPLRNNIVKGSFTCPAVVSLGRIEDRLLSSWPAGGLLPTSSLFRTEELVLGLRSTQIHPYAPLFVEH